MTKKLAPNRIWTLAEGCAATGYNAEALGQQKKRGRLAPTDQAPGRGYTTAQLWVAALLKELTRLGLNHDQGTNLLAGVNYKASFWRERNAATPSLLWVSLWEESEIPPENNSPGSGCKCNLQMVPKLVSKWASDQSQPGAFLINVTAILSAVDARLSELREEAEELAETDDDRDAG